VPKDLLKLTATVVDKATGSPAGIQRMGDITCSALVGWKQGGRVPGGDPHRKKAPTVKRASALPLHGGPEFHPGVDPRLGRFLVDALRQSGHADPADEDAPRGRAALHRPRDKSSQDTY